MTTAVEVCSHEDAYGPAVWDDMCILCDTTVVRSIGGSWRMVEDALPKGWAIQMLWGTVTEDRWAASAGPWPSKQGDRSVYAGGPDPAAALRALAATLKEPA